MIKGRVKLDFCDAITGKVKERIEGNNAFTNAIDSLLNKCPMGADRATLDGNFASRESVLDLAHTALGGVLIFPEEVGNGLYEPLTHQPTAYSRYGAQDTSDTKTGNWTNESTEITNGYRFVHEWGASYGNGTIKTVCLTNIYGAEAYGSKTFFGDKVRCYLGTGWTNTRPLGFCDGYYYFVDAQDTFATGTNIRRVKRPIYELLISQQSATYNSDAEIVYTSEASYPRCGLDEEGKKIYIVYGSTLKVIDLTDLSISTSTITIPSGAMPDARETYRNLVKRGNYLYWVKSYDNSTGAITIFKINLNNNADNDEISGTVATGGYRHDIYLMSDTGEINGLRFVLDGDDNLISSTTGGESPTYMMNRYGVWQAFKQRGSTGAGQYMTEFQINPYYMASKFVLESAYTKNSSLTMKLVYEVTHT